MDSGLYAACAGLIGRTQALELSANSIANASTVGFRSQRESFQQLYAGTIPANALNRVVNGYGVLGETVTDFSQGALEKTDNPLDLAIEGSGFFTVETKSGTRYTRAGNFRLLPDRTLVTFNGDPVIGEQGHIRVPNGKITIGSDGSVSVDDGVAARLKIVEFNSDAELKPVGTNEYSAPAASARLAKHSAVHQGMLESSNVTAVGAAVGLISIQRQAESMQRALSLFNNEFNRIAAQELSKI